MGGERVAEVINLAKPVEQKEKNKSKNFGPCQGVLIGTPWHVINRVRVSLLWRHPHWQKLSIAAQ